MPVPARLVDELDLVFDLRRPRHGKGCNLLGHSDTVTSEIYLQAVGVEKRQLVMQAWQ